LKALEKSGRRDPELLEALFGAQMRFAALHGHPAVPHLGSIELGLQAYNGAQRTLDLLFEGRPKDHNYTRKLMWVRDSLASTLIEAGQYDRSEAVCRESLLLIDKLESASWPASLANNMRGSTLMTLSRAPFHKKQWEECLALRNEGVRLKRLVASALRDPAYERDLAGVLAARGYLLREMGRIEEALDDYRKSDAIVIKLVEQGLKNVNTDWLLARNRLEEGKAELYRNNAAEAERLLSGALRVHRMLAAELPLAVSIQRTLALNLCFLAAAHHKLGSAPELWRNEFMEAGRIAAEALSRDRQNAKARDEAELIGRQAASHGVRLPPLPAP
jgi:tetratricopeptide (TPR) repeat protein